MFWALDERRKWRAKMRAEARAEGLAEGLAEGRVATERRYDAWLAKVAEERGIPLTALLPPQEDLE